MKLLFLGDFFYDFDCEKEDITEIINYINKNDYKVVLNLETTIVNAISAIEKRGPNLRSSLIIIDILKKMNCICVCLANNHAMDYCEKSLLATIDFLEKEGIVCIGAGKNLYEANKPFIINNQVAIFNYGWDIEETVYAKNDTAGCAPLDRKMIIKQLQKVKDKGYDVIEVFHWGFEFNTLPMPLDIDFAHKCINNGCDLIIGHHPHVVQPYEVYRNKEIYYSLGNFYFASRRKGFPNNYVNEEINNWGDYGLGVAFDLNTKQCKNVFFYYDRNQDKTIILSDNELKLKNMNEYSWAKKDYFDIARKHAYKNNPILGLDEKKNNYELRKLFFKYYIAKKINFLKKFSLGRKIYSILKKF